MKKIIIEINIDEEEVKEIQDRIELNINEVAVDSATCSYLVSTYENELSRMLSNAETVTIANV